MRINLIGSEQRQHINLSVYAYDAVINDSLTFMGKKNISGFINTIVTNLKTDSLAELASVEEERIKENLLRSGIKISRIDEEVIKEIANAHEYCLINPKISYPKDIVLKIRLNNRLCNELYSEYWDGNSFNISQGEYIKILIEEYARKPIFDREAVFFKERIEELTRYIDTSTLLILTTEKSRFHFKPYRMSKNYEANYNYVIGLSKMEDQNEYKVASFRLTRITGIKPLNKPSGKITLKEETVIKQSITERGVPYLLTPQEEFEIKLNNEGMRMFNQIFHQRPVYKELKTNTDGTFTMIITATERQITNYFFQFRENAVVISPQKTRISMQKWYENAANLYQKE